MTDAFRLGTMATDVLTGRVTLCLGTPVYGTTNTGVGYCFKRAGADYQVTALKTCYITALMQLAAAAQTLGSYFELRYADDAALTTNPVTLSGIPAAGAVIAVPVFISLGRVSAPAGKYVGVFNASGVNQAINTSYSMAIQCWEQ